ncbi:MAG: trigger factor [Clostridia bacterium]|nr:trigger factor [Clostridia bacterium]
MSLISANKIETNLYELKIGIDADKFAAAVNRVFAKQSKNITVPGFRKGKAPRSIIEKMYGKGVFYEDAINDLIPEVYTDAIKASELTVVSQPEFDIESVDENGVVLLAKVYVKPEANIEGYKGIEVTKSVSKTTANEVRAEIERVRERNCRMINVTDRAAQLGDTSNIDFEGSVDGVPFEGGKGENYSLVLGSNQFIPGFEDQIVGHNIGDEFDVNVKFPAEYHAAELADKDAVFKCKLNDLQVKELPELDDEFACDVSDFDTFAEYEADVKAKIKEKKEAEADRAVEDQLMEIVMEKLECEIPEAMYENETENCVRDYDTRLRMQGLDLKTYFQYTGMDLDALRAQLRPQAEKQVKARLALEKIAELENLAASDEEVEEEFTRLSEVYNMPVDKIKESIDAADLAEDIKVKKALELVKAEAVITKKTATKKAAAKKAAAAEEAAEEAPATEE